MKKDPHRALLAIVLAAIFGGAFAVFTKIGLRQVPPFSFTFLRFFIASICMIPFVLKEKHKIDKNILKVILFSFLGVANVTLFAFGIKLTTATVSQMLYAVVPLIAAIFSHFLLKEKIGFKKITGILTGLLGVLTLILLPILDNSSSFTGTFTGNMLVLIAVLSFALYTVFSKRFQKYYSPLVLTFILCLTTTIVLSPFLIRDYLINPIWFYNLTIFSWFSIFYAGIFMGVIYYLLYQYAIKHGTPIIASMILYFQPSVAFLLAFFLLSERLTLGIIIGGLLAVGGAWMVTRENLTHK